MSCYTQVMVNGTSSQQSGMGEEEHIVGISELRGDVGHATQQITTKFAAENPQPIFVICRFCICSNLFATSKNQYHHWFRGHLWICVEWQEICHQCACPRLRSRKAVFALSYCKRVPLVVSLVSCFCMYSSLLVISLWKGAPSAVLKCYLVQQEGCYAPHGENMCRR